MNWQRRRHLPRVPRPAKPVAPMFLSAGVSGGWWLVAHSSGQGWVQALGDFVFAILLVAVTGPSVAVARARVSVPEHTGPIDVSAGSSIRLPVFSTARVRVRPLDPPGPAQMVGPTRRGSPTGSGLLLEPRLHGAYTSILVEVASAAPFGLQWWARRLELAVPGALYVVPRRGRPDSIPASRGSSEDGSSSTRRRISPAGEMRAPRPYVPGDPQNSVHWPATAHTGELMVRDTDPPGAEPFEVVVALPAEPETAERVAEDAFATVLTALERDLTVLLTTDEAGGLHRALVPDRRQAGRRLAATVPAPPPSGGAES